MAPSADSARASASSPDVSSVLLGEVTLDLRPLGVQLFDPRRQYVGLAERRRGLVQAGEAERIVPGLAHHAGPAVLGPGRCPLAAEPVVRVEAEQAAVAVDPGVSSSIRIGVHVCVRPGPDDRAVAARVVDERDADSAASSVAARSPGSGWRSVSHPEARSGVEQTRAARAAPAIGALGHVLALLEVRRRASRRRRRPPGGRPRSSRSGRPSGDAARRRCSRARPPRSTPAAGRPGASSR